MQDGFLKVAAATPDVEVADCDYNTSKIIDMIFDAAEKKIAMIVFPELSITAYTCEDLFLRSDLIEKAFECLKKIKEKTKELSIISVIGLPFTDLGSLYNCAAVVYRGKILGIVPKKNLPNYSEFYEKRYFNEGIPFKEVLVEGEKIPFGTDLIFSCSSMKSFRFGIEICEDLWVSSPPSSDLASSGANLIANLSASSERVGKAEYRKSLVESHSARISSAYVYSSAGTGESTTDLVFSGHNIICELGETLAESKRFSTGFITCDVDLEKIAFEKRRTVVSASKVFHDISFDFDVKELDLERKFARKPFVPEDPDKLKRYCQDVVDIQSNGLAKRLRHINCKKVVVGISGGLDSTLALIISAKAFDVLGIDRSCIIAVTMPCFGTSEKTFNNAVALAKLYGTTFKKVDIKESVKEHFDDIGHDEKKCDVVYENAQARERTQVLMDLANELGAIVVGTGDLSELALGFSTYGGDHMSMYSVNASVPKTLIRQVVIHEANMKGEEAKKLLTSIVDTPVSPELLPGQNTENIVGPYELNDFFLYYFLRYGFSAKKIYRIAKIAFDGVYDANKIKLCLENFITRFFTQQFKRSCSPDGPKTGEVNLSPRGDFRMASDVSFNGFVI